MKWMGKEFRKRAMWNHRSQEYRGGKQTVSVDAYHTKPLNGMSFYIVPRCNSAIFPTF